MVATARVGGPPVCRARAQFVGSTAATIRPVGACSTAVSAGDSSMRCLRAETREVDGMNSGKPSGVGFHGNPEPSRRYTGGRCRDYLRARAPLITGWSVPHPHARARCAGEEIVHSRWKRRGKVNPLVVGSNPTGPNSTSGEHFFFTRVSGVQANRVLGSNWGGVQMESSRRPLSLALAPTVTPDGGLGSLGSGQMACSAGPGFVPPLVDQGCCENAARGVAGAEEQHVVGSIGHG
jgi:hypothetical protein